MVWLGPNLITALRQAWLKAHRGSQGLHASLQVEISVDLWDKPKGWLGMLEFRKLKKLDQEILYKLRMVERTG